jgi:hypothetical protein
MGQTPCAGLSEELVRVLASVEKEAPAVLRRPPRPGFVIKTYVLGQSRDASEISSVLQVDSQPAESTKVFINVCCLPEFPAVLSALDLSHERDALTRAARKTPHAHENHEGEMSRVAKCEDEIAVLVSKHRAVDADKQGAPCWVFQCGCSGSVLDAAREDREVKSSLIDCVLDVLEARGLAVVRADVRLPKMKQKGGDIPEVLRWGFDVRAQETEESERKTGAKSPSSAPSPLLVASKTTKTPHGAKGTKAETTAMRYIGQPAAHAVSITVLDDRISSGSPIRVCTQGPAVRVETEKGEVVFDADAKVLLDGPRASGTVVDGRADLEIPIISWAAYLEKYAVSLG